LNIGNLISENGSESEYLLERIESIMTEEVKLPRDILCYKTKVWTDISKDRH